MSNIPPIHHIIISIQRVWDIYFHFQNYLSSYFIIYDKAFISILNHYFIRLPNTRNSQPSLNENHNTVFSY